MKLDELRTVQSKERRKDSLQQLRDSFYEDVAAYLQDLKASRDRRAQQVDDPFSDDEVRQLSDELDTATEVAEAVYERRVGKVVKLASFAAADMPVDDEGMTSEERRLFDDLVDRIERNKRSVLDVLSGESDPSTTDPEPAGEPAAPPSPTERVDESEPADGAADGVLADAMGGGSEPAADREEQPAPTDAGTVDDPAAPTDTTPADAAPEASTEAPTDRTPNEIPPPEAEPEPEAVIEPSTDGGTTTEVPADAPSTEQPATTATAGGAAEANGDSAADTDDEDRTTLRITKNVGEIFGVDGREYTLRSEDVVTLPTANADPLVDRDAAMRLD
ncbi:hypothetical protein [Halohasta salina]|uniref:DNA replication complex subunit Gins51 n=1 Tax=Halohasta salina TaxID=2961621 RepID=UPI0020A52D1A|nr:hypothetical protein [Halohasta salina]